MIGGLAARFRTKQDVVRIFIHATGENLRENPNRTRKGKILL